jgi:hypothetical protein
LCDRCKRNLSWSELQVFMRAPAARSRAQE